LDLKNTASLQTLVNCGSLTVAASGTASDTDHIGNHPQEFVF
jgi:hypothetical protein